MLKWSMTIVSIFILWVAPLSAWALVPIESLVLGDLSRYYSQEKQDPLNSVFEALDKTRQSSGQETLVQAKERLAYYRGLLDEGGNLQNYCSRSKEVEYATAYDRDQALRSIFAHLQYRGLDYSIRALAEYAHYFNFSKMEYQNLVDTMVGGSCSQNISIISLAQLKKNMMARFEDSSYELPSVEGNPLFPPKLSQIVSKDETREREMQHTLKLFRAFCSWGGLSDRPRLLTPILKHPAVMAYLTLDMEGLAFDWEPVLNKVRKVDRPNRSAVACQNLICRRVERSEFERRMPRMVGSTNLSGDLRRLYCGEFKEAQMSVHEDESKQVAKVMNEVSEQNEGPMLATHFLALVTGVPDLLLRTKKWNQAQKIAESSVEWTWGQWARQQTENFSRDLYYEEPLSLELVERDLYLNRKEKKLEVQIDVNLGEFDRVNQKIGKLGVKFDVDISKPFLMWAQRQWSLGSGDVVKRREKIEARFQKIIQDDVEKARKDFIIPPWSGKLERLIVTELLAQLENSPSNLFSSLERETVQIPVQLNFAPFALKYQHYRAQVARNKRRVKERERIRELRQEQNEIAQDLEQETRGENWAKAPQE